MGKGDKKSKRGKIIMGSWGVRRPGRKRKVLVPAVQKTVEKPSKAEKAIEEPVEAQAVVIEQPKSEEKKTQRKAPVKKAAEGDTEKPKAAKTKKKSAAEGETLFDQKQEPETEK